MGLIRLIRISPPILASVVIRYQHWQPDIYTELRANIARFSSGRRGRNTEALAKKAGGFGYHTIGICDTADPGGVVPFVLERRRQGIKPGVDAELNVARRYSGKPVNTGKPDV